MNRCVERLYNGIIKENPTFRHDARNVSDTCGNDFRHQRNRNGTLHNGGTGTVQYDDFRTSENHSGFSPYPGVYRSRCIFRNDCTFLLQGFVPSLYDSLGHFTFL